MKQSPPENKSLVKYRGSVNEHRSESRLKTVVDYMFLQDDILLLRPKTLFQATWNDGNFPDGSDACEALSFDLPALVPSFF